MGCMQEVPPQAFRQHFRIPRHCKSERQVMAQIPTPTGGGHSPGFCAQTSPTRIKSTKNLICVSHSERYLQIPTYLLILYPCLNHLLL
jgi:hypothetical protein